MLPVSQDSICTQDGQGPEDGMEGGGRKQSLGGRREAKGYPNNVVRNVQGSNWDEENEIDRLPNRPDQSELREAKYGDKRGGEDEAPGGQKCQIGDPRGINARGQ